MKKFMFIIPLLAALVAGCSPLRKNQSTFFTKKEVQLLRETTSAIGYDYGYDSETDLDYVFTHKYGEKGIAAKSEKMKNILSKYDRRLLVPFFEKIWILKFKSMKTERRYREAEKWREYTHINKYLLPSLETYTGLLEEQLLKEVPEYRGKIASRKKDIEIIFTRR